MFRRTVIALIGSLYLSQTANALVYEQVAFDSADVCWWSLAPPDPVCPVLKQENLTAVLENLKSSHQWQGGSDQDCEGAYCLYANRGWAGGRGIAVITNSEGLAKVKQVGDLLQEYKISIADDSENVPFRTSYDEEMDREVVVATNAMKRGDPIMAHTPVLLVHRSFREDAPLEKQQHLLDLAVKALPATTAKKLKNRMSDGESVHAMLAAQSFEVNWVAASSDGNNNNNNNNKAPTLHDGVFPEAASISHDCRPNTASYVDPTTLMHITTAARPIHPSEELTLSRLDPFATLEERQAQAHARWGSGCTCSQCTLSSNSDSDTAAADSATRLREIKWIEAKLADPTSTEVSTGLITYHLGLHENERLHCCLAKAYALAAGNFNMLGYDKYAVKYADLAIEAFQMEKGESAPEVREMEEFRQNVMGHATWKARVKASKKGQSMLGVTEAAMTAKPPTSTPGPTFPAQYR